MTTGRQQPLDVRQLVLDAIERCQGHLSPTPLEYSRYFSVRWARAAISGSVLGNRCDMQTSWYG